MPLVLLAVTEMGLIREALSYVGVPAEIDYRLCFGESGRAELNALLDQVDSHPEEHILLPSIESRGQPHLIAYLGREEDSKNIVVANNHVFEVAAGSEINYGIQRMKRDELIEAVVDQGQGAYLINLSST
jgi:hypothetical protein